MMKKSFILFLAIIAVSCNGFKSIKSVFNSASPYEKYIESLKKASLLDASMTKEWLVAGETVFDDSVFVNVPFSETGFFQASKPEARSYRFHAKDGQVLTINGAVKTRHDARLFLDLFVLDGDEWERIASADSTYAITYEFSNDEECIIRLQPELLANAYYAINLSLTPVLINPVFGASNRSIGSFYGAPRDNGKRSHEGVDIFAAKGTPVIAPTDGYISRVGVNQLGGKVVWMKDPKRRHSYYFAHLDSQMVKPGMRVFQGHVLGLVGNTGNAKRTPPHLHFGIYQSGSKDPLYYIQTIGEAIESLPVDTGFQQKPLKVHRKEIPLMSGASDKLPMKQALVKDTYVTVIGESREWYRVSLPDDQEGYVFKKHVGPLTPGSAAELDSSRWLMSGIDPDALPIETLVENAPVEVLARFDKYRFVITAGGMAGWIAN